ncbi:hypothetical protein [Parabacteroides leei]|uniref:hypothetical protein n=1 Tax=Parabacteroides leei TaxID=2939491 RepID=UPI003242D339
MNKISENTTNKTIKIVYCIPDLFRPGGIERIISMKTNYLAEYNNGNSYDITIITTGQGKRPAYYEFSNKIKFIDLDINYDEIVSYSFLKRILIRREKKKKQIGKSTERYLCRYCNFHIYA